MRSFILSFIRFFLMSFFSIAVLANTPPTVVLYGDDDYSPYSFVKNKEFTGIYVDVLKLAAKHLATDYHIKIKPIPWKRGLLNLQTGEAFALFPPYYKKERDFIQPYSVALYHETVSLFCNKDLLEKILPDFSKITNPQFPKDFNRFNININLGFFLSNKFSESIKNRAIKIKEIKGNEENVNLLIENKASCYANDRAAILYTGKKILSPDNFKRLQEMEITKIEGQDAFIGYSKKHSMQQKEDFIKKMNAFIEIIKKSGELKKIVDSYMTE